MFFCNYFKPIEASYYTYCSMTFFLLTISIYLRQFFISVPICRFTTFFNGCIIPLSFPHSLLEQHLGPHRKRKNAIYINLHTHIRLIYLFFLCFHQLRMYYFRWMLAQYLHKAQRMHITTKQINEVLKWILLSFYSRECHVLPAKHLTFCFRVR